MSKADEAFEKFVRRQTDQYNRLAIASGLPRGSKLDRQIERLPRWLRFSVYALIAAHFVFLNAVLYVWLYTAFVSELHL